MKKILVPLAKGFEEIEAVSIIDVLRRAGAEVVVASVSSDDCVCSSHNVRILADCALNSVDSSSFDMIALPGGSEGAMTLSKDALAQKLIKEFHANGKFVAAICAAPIALHAAGILQNVPYTCYPGCNAQIGGLYTEDKNVVVSGNIITSRGPATALAFALTLVEALFGTPKAKELAAGMLKTCC